MTEDNESNETGEGFDAGSKEREAHYPDSGFALVEIDMMRPMGEALTGLVSSETLTGLEMREGTELIDYVIYDADSQAYTHEDLAEMKRQAEHGQVATLLKDFQSDDLHTKRLALYGLAIAAEDSPEACIDAIPLLATALDAPERDIRVGSLEVLATLSETHAEQVTPVVDEAITFLGPDTNETKLEHAVTLVKNISERNPHATIEAPPKLAQVLQTDVARESAVMTALTRIAEVYPDAVVPAVDQLLEYIDDGSHSQRVGALGLVGTISKEYPEVARSTIPTVTEFLEADEYALRANAAGLLAELAGEYPAELRSAVPVVIELLDDDDQKARYNATSILARVAKEYPETAEPAVDSLMGVLDDDFAFTRGNACWALGHLQASEALTELETLAEEDPDEEVRAGARFAVQEISESSSS